MEIERIRTGVKALIVQGDKILVIKERINRPDTVEIIHDFPGGGIDPGEDLKEALKREVFEEVGLKIKVGQVVGAWDFIVPKFGESSSHQEGVHIVCIGYQCSLVSDAGNKEVLANTPVSQIALDMDSNPAAIEDIFETLWLTKKEILVRGDELLHSAAMRKAVENLAI